MNDYLLSLTGLVYRKVLKPVLFQINPEQVHERAVSMGEYCGTSPQILRTLSQVFTKSFPSLSQELAGINFSTPVGLAAGFDYEARLTQILPALGFGFQTVGTITNSAYGGNSQPMLGRLPKSRSLMVNKGFKNLGAKATIAKLSGLEFAIPVGVSIGRTNSVTLKAQNESIADIVRTFTLFEKSPVTSSYYELNISCPNLTGTITFYPRKNLQELLIEIDKLHLAKPLFVKMPISETDKDILEMLEEITNHNVQGVIFGNLQKDRTTPGLRAEEVANFNVGNFSGKPTFSRSNDLIKLAYKTYGKNLTIIGCGGVFNADDAWEKIVSGASLVQLITGLVFEGPQLVAEINKGLAVNLANLGLNSITEARGLGSRI